MSRPVPANRGNPIVRPIRVAKATPGRSRHKDLAFLSKRRRQRTIRHIEEQTGQTLLCYVSQGVEIDVDDVLCFHELLDGVQPGSSIGLLLNSIGGSVDVAEKLVQMLRQRTSPSGALKAGRLQVIVPDQAKSAATLLAIGADEILMSSSSELGPTDPYIRVEENGREILYSAFDYVDAYEKVHKDCTENPSNDAFGDILGGFDVVFVEEMRKAIARAQQVTEQILRDRGDINATLAATKLTDRELFPSHAQMIGFRRAREIGLDFVKFIDSTEPLWRMYWELYLDLRRAAANDRKVFESRHVSRTA